MKTAKRTLATILAIAILSLSYNSVHAARVSNEQVISQTQQLDAQKQLVDIINRADVKQQLLALGVGPEHVTSRINQMTADEIAQLNRQIEALPAGGDLLGVLLVVFIVFVITNVIGATDIFPFIKSIK